MKKLKRCIFCGVKQANKKGCGWYCSEKCRQGDTEVKRKEVINAIKKPD